MSGAIVDATSRGERTSVEDAALRAGWSGSAWVFSIALLWLLVWFVTGPLFGYSERWQLGANTGTTLVTFLVVFLIQREQDRDSRAIQLKLNELIAVVGGASNHLIGCEHRSAVEQQALQLHFHRLSELARQGSDLATSHSVEAAEARHERTRHRGFDHKTGEES